MSQSNNDWETVVERLMQKHVVFIRVAQGDLSMVYKMQLHYYDGCIELEVFQSFKTLKSYRRVFPAYEFKSANDLRKTLVNPDKNQDLMSLKNSFKSLEENP
jgi:hypothetical protein